MKNLLFLLLLCPLTLVAQKTITGKVITDKDTPLEGAAVYLNNTSIGTTTNENGEFELTLKEGTYDLIASFLGFETARFTLDTRTINQSITFKLSPKANMLNEVVVSNKRSAISPEDRAYFLSQFRRSFLGKTLMSYQCKIVNEDAIDFDYNKLSGVLEAYASEPIIIDHKGLGYRIYYDLVHFELEPKRVTFLGYTRYENSKGSKRKQRKWKKKRKVAYNGSITHFLNSIMSNTVKEEGFVVDHYKRIPNPDRPSDSIIALAREQLKKINGDEGIKTFKMVSSKDLNDKKTRDQLLQKVNQIEKIRKNSNLESLKDKDFKVTINQDGTFEATTQAAMNQERDSLTEIVRKARLKRFVDVEVKKDLTTSEFSEKVGDTYYLKFPDYLKIKYMKEPEEDNFRRGAAKLNYQASLVTLYVDRAKIDPIGVLVNPLDMFLEGYWSYEKIGDALPLDYDPEKD